MKFNQWCRNATRLIRFGPDKEAVAQELRGHMEDHYDALIEKNGYFAELVARQRIDGGE